MDARGCQHAVCLLREWPIDVEPAEKCDSARRLSATAPDWLASCSCLLSMDWLRRVGACGLLLGGALCASCSDDALSQASGTPEANGDEEFGDGDGSGGSDS